MKRIFSIVIIFLMMILFTSCVSTNPGGEANQLGGITGRVFLDEDADQECDECDCDYFMENIIIQLFVDRCAGTATQNVKTDEDGVFTFSDLEPGNYCVSPKVKLLCEGYQPTTPITQKVEVKPGEVVEADWFGFDHYLDVNE